MDRLTEILADTPLGQQHFSLGPMLHVQQPMGNHFDIECFGEIEYLVPGNEIRFFKIIKNPEEFNRDYASAALAQDNLDFLDQQATLFLYPAATKIKVKPGAVFHAWTEINAYWWKDFQASVGYDVWAQKQEKLGCVKMQYTEQGTGPLNIAAGVKHGAIEGKLFATIGTTLCGGSYDMRLVFRGDATIHNTGIGRSFTAGLNFILEF